MQLHMRGVRVRVRLRDEPDTEGWLWSERDGELLVSLDRDGRHIRLIRPGQLSGVAYDYDDRAAFSVPNARQIEERLQSFEERFGRAVVSGIYRLDVARIRSIIDRARRLAANLSAAELAAPLSSEADPLTEFRLARTAAALRLAEQLREELDRAELLDLLDMLDYELAELPLDHTLPAADLQVMAPFFQREDQAGEQIHRHAAVRRLRERLESVEQEQSAYILGKLMRREQQGKEAGASRDEPVTSYRGTIPRWIAASLRIAGGAALTGFNAVAGISSGIAGTILTIGATAVPTAVGVAVSMHTGISQMAEGLEKAGALMKESAEAKQRPAGISG